MKRAPSFTFGVVAVLALGIGANTAIFSSVNALLLRPLPFPDSDRLVRLFHVPPQSTFPAISLFSVSPANFHDWQSDSRTFERMAIYHGARFTMTGSGNQESVLGTAVGDGFFDIVGISPELGRAFLREEDSPARKHVVIMSDGFWKSHFGGSRDVLGRTLMLDGEPYTVVGVMPPSFTSLHEIGIRAALGAGTSDVLRLIIAEGLTPPSLGIAAGVGGALVSGTFLRKIMYGASASDPFTLACVSLVLLVVSILASIEPAWRASRVDPLIVLRD